MDKISPVIARLAGNSVYIDTNIFIYFLDGNKDFLAVVAPFLEAVSAGKIIGYTGDAVIAETMVRPYKIGNIAMIEQFKAFFYREEFLTILPHDSKTFDVAAQISAKHGMKLIDALHLATALQAGCKYLITQDMVFKQVEGVELVNLKNIL